ncbi:TorF family putative porin [Phenylobacterium immobile]|uniref:TorF family putative porin n=1 Tax=Phenylobacterium immobile TaxID=21 RepID=UPI000A871FC4|nr:TorF family putative porin [Phenylobacterium immobile]
MKTLKLSLAAAAATLAVAGAASAQDAPTFAFNVGVNNDYVFRGVSQTNEDPSVFGGVDASSGIFYAGVWASNVDFGNDTDLEYDLYAGVKPVVGAVTFDLGAVRYGYTGSPSGSNQDYWEFKGAASVPVGIGAVGVAAYYSPEFFGGIDSALYYEVNGSVSIPETKLSISGAVGHQQLDGPGDYTTWNAGIGYALTDHFAIDLRYHDTDEHSFGKIYDSRFVATIKAMF